MRGQLLTLPLQSIDKREQFLLDLSRGRIDLVKVKMQNRGRHVVVLVRLEDFLRFCNITQPPHVERGLFT
jgi:uncharacterized protein DUF6978